MIFPQLFKSSYLQKEVQFLMILKKFKIIKVQKEKSLAKAQLVRSYSDNAKKNTKKQNEINTQKKNTEPKHYIT